MLVRRFATIASIGEMSQSSCEAKQHLLNSGCIESVLEAMKAHGQDEAVAGAGCAFFTNIAVGSDARQQRLFQSGCIAAVRSVIATHGDDFAGLQGKGQRFMQTMFLGGLFYFF